MTDTVLSGPLRRKLGLREIVGAAAATLVLIGLLGVSHAAVGYGFFLVASLLLILGFGLLAIFALSPWFDTRRLRSAYAGAFWLGAWSYLLALASMSGYYLHEAMAGRIEWRYMIFGPAALAAIIILDAGIWRVIVKRNLPTVQRFGDLWRRDTLDQPALRRTLIDEVVLHRTLFSISPFRWVRHQLIFWGFTVMLLVELLAVAFREAFPAFGWTRLWYQPDHPVRLSLDFAFELTGLMMMVGCVLAIGFRIRAQGSDLQKFTDTPTAVFLLAVLVTGFVAEGARMALAGAAPGGAASFIGLAIAAVWPASNTWHDGLWTLHALLACGFIAYVPLKRMVHSCAAPIGRLCNSQVSLLAAKKARSIGGLFRGQAQD